MSNTSDITALADRLLAAIAPASRLLTAAEFHQLANVRPEVEWFANISNAHAPTSSWNFLECCNCYSPHNADRLPN
jgi:hypothetical protein